MNTHYLHNVTGIDVTGTERMEIDGIAYGSRQLIISFENGDDMAIALFADGESIDSDEAIEEALRLTGDDQERKLEIARQVRALRRA